jgi:HNH endonuclease
VSVSVSLEELRSWRAKLAAFDPALLTGEDCAAMVGEFAGLEKASEAAKTLTASRAASCGAHRAAGFTDAPEWLAGVSGTTTGAARSALETATELRQCPQTMESVRAGDVSLAEAGEITRTEALQPGSEGELLAVAGSGGLNGLRNRARRIRQQALDVDELHRRRLAARHVRHWRTEIGNVAGTFELPPEVGIPFVNRLDAETDRLRRSARQRGEPLETRDAYAADALVHMASGGGKGHATRADVVVTVDLRALRRGHAHTGEPCGIVGGGPIPVEVANELMQDAFLKAVLHDGVAIHTVKHFGRYRPAELRTALELGAPPDFAGVECVEPDCTRRYGLEWDHVDPVANDGPTSYDNLQPRCWPHHRDKTELDRLAGLLDGRVKAGRREKRGPP